MNMTAAATQAQTTTADIVARNLSRELANQRWSARQAAFKLGLNPMYVTRRINGEVECTASDLVMFAGLLRIPVTRLLDLDSNQEPAGFTPAPEMQPIVDMATRRKPRDTAPNHTPAIVSTFPLGA